MGKTQMQISNGYNADGVDNPNPNPAHNTSINPNANPDPNPSLTLTLHTSTSQHIHNYRKSLCRERNVKSTGNTNYISEDR